MTSRRSFLQRSGALALLAAIEPLLSRFSWGVDAVSGPSTLTGETINLVIAETPFRVGDRSGSAITINGTVPGPLIRLRQGQDVTIRATNRLREISSIHWHGVLVPPEMDGVPGVSFAGIGSGSTFTYRFPIKQSGTYWYHSHSGGQEQHGMYAPLIFDPIEPDPVKYDREHVVMLSDWTFASMEAMIGNLKKEPGYFNYQRRTILEFFAEVKRKGWRPTVQDYLMWARMRMDPTDLLDVTSSAYTYLMNGLSPEANWTALFRPGERVRLRFVQVGVMAFQDVRIPGLKMTVVQADGQNVQPVEVDEFRIGPAETYDVIVEPKENHAYTIFAETLDRSGYARGTLAPRPGMQAAIPKLRSRPIHSMKDMGMDMSGNDMPFGHGTMQMPSGDPAQKQAGAPNKNPEEMGMDMGGMDMHPGTAHDMSAMQHQHSHPASGQARSEIPGSTPVKHGPDHHGSGNQAVPEVTQSRLDDPGTGLENDERRVLVYTDLKSLHPYADKRKPERELEIHLTGNMERFMWSFDGKKYSQAQESINFRYGERLRWTFVNDTMMEHTLHLHGMWMYLENGAGEYLPRKHTVLVKPAERLSVLITPEPRGPWAFHCHLLLHMEAGMFRVVQVSDHLPGDKS